MEINLSWDLFVIVFFTVIIAYSFIIGRDKTAKVIISTYVAILASDGIGNIIQRYFMGDKPILTVINLSGSETSLVIMKIVIFVFTTVLIATRGRFHINMGRSDSGAINIILSFTYGLLSAGLITSTILIYASGTSLVQESAAFINQAMIEIYRQSSLVQLMINNYNIWFSLPAITFMLSSLIGEAEQTA
jgi:hypothetical protein